MRMIGMKREQRTTHEGKKIKDICRRPPAITVENRGRRRMDDDDVYGG